MENSSEVDHSRVSRAIAKLTADQKIYTTRAMRSDFVNKFSKLTKAVLQSMFKSLMEDGRASNCAAEKKTVAQALFNLGDPGINLDLGTVNGDPKATKFDYWQEPSFFLEKNAAVDNRQHSDIPHIPIAVSICSL